MPDTISLPSGMEIRYEYDSSNPINPARRFRDDDLTTEFIWADPLRLAAYKDHDNELEYMFFYDRDGILTGIRLDRFQPPRPEPEPDWATESADWLTNKSRPESTPKTRDWVKYSQGWLRALTARGRRARLEAFLETVSLPLDLYCGCDQVGTVKLLTDAYGFPVKEILYDSFGVQRQDSLPVLFLPIGFAGGLHDPDTGLVRFGYRDYDPTVGRFTAPDPAKDMRGDGDIYDYCVDDPVNATDPTGLWTKANFIVESDRAAFRALARFYRDGSHG